MEWQTLIFESDAQEMASDAVVTVPLNSDRVQALLATLEPGEKPEFPLIRVQGGTSKNKSDWDGVFQSIAEQVNEKEPVAHLGHIPDDQLAFALPDPQTIWLGATVAQEQGQPVLYVKGFNLSGAKIRKLWPAGAVTTTSWKGRAKAILGRDGTKVVKEFVLDSIDWTRKGSAGMNTRLLAVTQEMTTEEGGGKDVEIGQVTEDDLKKGNPNLLLVIENRVRSEQQSALQEMEKKAEAADESNGLLAALRTKLGLKEDDNLLEAITKMVDDAKSVTAKTVTDALRPILGKAVKDEKQVSALLRLIPEPAMQEMTACVALDDNEKLSSAVNEWVAKDDVAQEMIRSFGGGGVPTFGGSSNGKESDKAGERKLAGVSLRDPNA